MTLTNGCFAYYDSFAGLIPCKVIRIGNLASTVKLTATRGPYKRGEMHSVKHGRAIPRAAVVVRCGQYRILPFNVA